MDAIQALKTRKSIRNYTKEQVKKEDLETILECGALAPTGCNKQPFIFIVVDNERIKKGITDLHPYSKGDTNAHYIITVFSDFENAITPVEDACAATENMMIAAAALGYGTCWLQAYNEEWAEHIEKLLNAPKGYRIISMMTLGCFQDTGNRSPKKPLEEIIRYNSF